MWRLSILIGTEYILMTRCGNPWIVVGMQRHDAGKYGTIDFREV
jgi:hypothetical protein